MIGRDCRSCKHNTYGDSPQITDYVDCMHPVTLAKTPRWEEGDPQMVNWRGADVHVRELQHFAPCPTWEAKPTAPEGK